MRLLRGVVQHYAWGDARAIPDLLGVPNDGRPWAEWWMGTHPGGPATFDDGTPLRDVSGELPYLVKLLAAAQPLSLQTHPDTATAQAGFRRENDLGIDLADPSRIYRDPFAKPEVLVALTPFDALCGFRAETETVHLLRDLGLDDVAAQLLDDGLAMVVGGLYRGSIDAAPIVRACATAHRPEATLVTRLEAAYPGDASVAVTLFLNRVRLHPGEAIYLTPGNLHAYLDGLGVEVMGASDNVVRGGLTPKHVDVDELLRVLRFEALAEPVIHAVAVGADVWR
jgi:mannose-6-phosphate isomerase